ncbi:MAG: TonB-dependent receptor [Gemmatimonadaceae bacterium]
MYARIFVVLLFGAPFTAHGQQPATIDPDSTRRVGRDTTRQPVRLTEVTVVATPSTRAAPASTLRLDALAIRESPADGPWDLLRQSAGVEVHEQGQGPGFASDASVRGFSSDHSTDLALWIDGVPINEPVNGHAEGYSDWSLLFPAAIRDITVIKGPTSAVFGDFALAGVVNVRTLERMRGTRATVSGGSYGRVDGSVVTGFDHDAAGGGVLGIRAAHGDGWRPNSASDLAQVHARVLHDVSTNTTVDGGIELYGARWRSPGYLGEAEFARRAYYIVSNVSDGGFKRRAQERVSIRTLTGPLLWRTTAYATQGLWSFYLTIPPAGGRFEGTGSQTEEIDARAAFGLTSALTWAFRRGELSVGGETRWDRAHYQNWFTTARARDSSAVLVVAQRVSEALFVQAVYDVTERVRMTAGGRLDAFATRSAPTVGTVQKSTHAVVSPKIGALVRVAPGLGVYGNISRGFRSSDGVVTDPTLAPVTAWAYESGIKVDGRVATVSAALFRVDVGNEQTLDPLTRGASSGGSSRRQGLELDIVAPLGDALHASADWTLNDARYTSRVVAAADPTTPPLVLTGLRVYNTARSVGSATLELKPIRAAWHARVSANWVGSYSPFDEPGVILGGFGLLHGGVGVRVGAVQVEMGIRNVLDRAYPELVARHIVAPGSPRTGYGRVEYAF